MGVDPCLTRGNRSIQRATKNPPILGSDMGKQLRSTKDCKAYCRHTYNLSHIKKSLAGLDFGHLSTMGRNRWTPRAAWNFRLRQRARPSWLSNWCQYVVLLMSCCCMSGENFSVFRREIHHANKNIRHTRAENKLAPPEIIRNAWNLLTVLFCSAL